jgi:hypothetical protein
MQADPEFERWQRQWRAQPAVPIDLRRLVERDIRSRRIGMLGSIAVTAIMGGGMILWAVRSSESDRLELAFAVWVFIAIAWAVTIRLERLRGPWRPLTDTTAAFLESAIRTRHATALYVAFFVFMLVWRYRLYEAEAPRGEWDYLLSARVMVLCGISVALGLFALAANRRITRELQNLVATREAAEPSE